MPKLWVHSCVRIDSPESTRKCESFKKKRFVRDSLIIGAVFIFPTEAIWQHPPLLIRLVSYNFCALLYRNDLRLKKTEFSSAFKRVWKQKGAKLRR